MSETTWTPTIANCDQYLGARTGRYERRRVRYLHALHAMQANGGLTDQDTVMDVGAGAEEQAIEKRKWGKKPVVILCNDYFNAVYVDSLLQQDGKPEYLDAETLARTNPDAAVYVVPQDVYDEVLDGQGYPFALADFPLDRCSKVR